MWLRMWLYFTNVTSAQIIFWQWALKSSEQRRRQDRRLPLNMAAELHVLHVNVNGLRARKTECELYLSETKPHIVLLNETKLCGKPVPRFAGYQTAAVRDRTSDKIHGGGVAILVSKSVTFSDISHDVDDIVDIEVSTENISLPWYRTIVLLTIDT